MSMPLHDTLSLSELNDSDRFDFLAGVVDRIKRVDEIHATDEDDSTYHFLVWLKDPEQTQSVVSRIYTNIKGSDPGWVTTVFVAQHGLLLITSVLA